MLWHVTFCSLGQQTEGADAIIRDLETASNHTHSIHCVPLYHIHRQFTTSRSKYTTTAAKTFVMNCLTPANQAQQLPSQIPCTILAE